MGKRHRTPPPLASSAKGPARFEVGDVHGRALVGRGERSPGVWYWQARTYGASTERTIWHGWASREEAIEHVAGLVQARRADAPRPRTGATVRDALEWFGAQQHKRVGRGNLKESSLRQYKTRARALVRHIGTVRLADLRLEHLDGYTDRRRAEPGRRGAIDLRTIRSELTLTLKPAIEWCTASGRISRREIEWPEYSLKKPAPKYTPERAHLTAILEALGDHWARTAVFLQCATGARIGEIGGLRWRDFDPDGRTLRVDEKTGPREVPIRQPVVDELLVLRGIRWRPDARILGVSQGTCRAETNRWLHRAQEVLEVPRFTTHALRRMVTDELVDAGVDLAVVAGALGYSVVTLLVYYRDKGPKRRREAVELVGLGDLLPPLAGTTTARQAPSTPDAPNSPTGAASGATQATDDVAP